VNEYKSFYRLYKSASDSDVDFLPGDGERNFSFKEYISNQLSEIAGVRKSFNILINNEKIMGSYIRSLMSSDDPHKVLISGETGVGKEIIARAIHNFSDRSENKFRALNSVAVPDTLFDSEISGILKGVATNVPTRLGIFLSACKSAKEGYTVENNKIVFKRDDNSIKQPSEEELKSVGGTVFLDEINSLPLHSQAKILRILQENEVRVLGEHRSRKINVKFICSSNENLYGKVIEGKFREDLYHRVSGQIVNLPPLREMKEVIYEYTEQKIEEICVDVGYGKKVTLKTSAKNKLLNYDWPGNFRELNNVLYRAICELRLEGKNYIMGKHILFPAKEVNIPKLFDAYLLNLSFDELEKKYISLILKKAGGNETKARKFAGFSSRTRLHLKKLEILPEIPTRIPRSFT